MKAIQILISPAGDVRITTQGFAGPECQAASKSLEEVLGAVTQSQKTTEYYRPTQMQSQILNSRLDG